MSAETVKKPVFVVYENNIKLKDKNGNKILTIQKNKECGIKEKDRSNNRDKHRRKIDKIKEKKEKEGSNSDRKEKLKTFYGLLYQSIDKLACQKVGKGEASLEKNSKEEKKILTKRKDKEKHKGFQKEERKNEYMPTLEKRKSKNNNRIKTSRYSATDRNFMNGACVALNDNFSTKSLNIVFTNKFLILLLGLLVLFSCYFLPPKRPITRVQTTKVKNLLSKYQCYFDANGLKHCPLEGGNLRRLIQTEEKEEYRNGGEDEEVENEDKHEEAFDNEVDEENEKEVDNEVNREHEEGHEGDFKIFKHGLNSPGEHKRNINTDVIMSSLLEIFKKHLDESGSGTVAKENKREFHDGGKHSSSDIRTQTREIRGNFKTRKDGKPRFRNLDDDRRSVDKVVNWYGRQSQRRFNLPKEETRGLEQENLMEFKDNRGYSTNPTEQKTDFDKDIDRFRPLNLKSRRKSKTMTRYN